MHVVIIGNGISGITAARWIRKLSDHRITVISSETKEFYSRTALMYIYMGHMRLQDTQPYESHFWEKNNINLIQGHVNQIDFEKRALQVASLNLITYDKLILAVGSTPNKFGWPGQDLGGVRGLYHYQDLEYLEKYSPNIDRGVIVGGGLIGIELAEMLRSRNKQVSILVREASYWNNVLPPEESAMVNAHILEHGVDLRLSTELSEIMDDGKGNVAAVKTNTGENIDCQYVGLTAGVRPNVAWLKESPLHIERGIVVDNTLQSNLEHVYAIGDCAQLASPSANRRAIEAVWYTGRMMGETVAYNICGQQKSYVPKLWFNSAKFFDIEYQVYGNVPAKPNDELSSLYWQHSKENKSIRIVYNANHEVVGFNLMGIRYRHEVCEKWILNKAKLKEVVPQLSLANFDPEFYHSYQTEILKAFSQQSGLRFDSPTKGRSLDRVLAFLKR